MKQTPPAAVGRRHLLEISASAAGVIALSACSGSPPEPGKGRPDTTPEQEVPVTAPEDLMREHGVLKRILLIYREGIRRLQADDQSPAPALNESAQIIRRFIEDYHGQLEEQYVFPKLEQAGKLTDITSVLRTQHQRGRVLTDRVLAATTAAAAFDQPARDTLAQDMAAYIRMFEPHEAREDTVVFPALRDVMSAVEFRDMAATAAGGSPACISAQSAERWSIPVRLRLSSPESPKIRQCRPEGLCDLLGWCPPARKAPSEP